MLARSGPTLHHRTASSLACCLDQRWVRTRCETQMLLRLVAMDGWHALMHVLHLHGQCNAGQALLLATGMHWGTVVFEATASGSVVAGQATWQKHSPGP